MSSQSYLMCRNGVYYFRISVPSNIVQNLHRKEITFSLRTKSHRDAKMKLSAMISNAYNLFEHIKTMVQVTKEQADKLIQHYLRDQIDNSGFTPNKITSFLTYGAKLDRIKGHIDDYYLERSDFDFLATHERDTLHASDLKRLIKPYKHDWRAC